MMKAGKPERSDVTLEILTMEQFDQVEDVHREDVSEEFADGVEYLREMTRYGLCHHCLGHTFAVKYRGQCVGFLLLGEALHWKTDPPEMALRPFYRLMCFVIDRRFRGMGIGGIVLEEAVRRVYEEFGPRPIALGVHEENTGAARFYLRHGFRKTEAMDGRDRYFLRYPEQEETAKKDVE